MAELEVDQTNLPKVQEVCQCFAVLEDGALAHNLQEQEIEQYYSSNVQRSQLVQKDIRVAKRLQDEEEHTAHVLHQQTTRRLEERDSEYAQMIQEEIQRRAEEAQRREVEDEEIAKRIQEEEELCLRRRGSYQNRDCRETTSVPVPPYSPPAVPTPHTEDRCYIWSPTRRWQHSFSPPYSDSEEHTIGQSRPTAVTNRHQAYQDCRPAVGQRMLISHSRPPRAHLDQNNRSTTSQSGSTVSQRSGTSHFSGGWGDVVKLIKNDLNEQGYLSHSSEDELFEPVYKLERILKQKQQVSDQHSNGGTRLSRHSSARDNRSRTWQGGGSGPGERERHVRFLDEKRRLNSYHGNGSSLNESGHNITRQRGEVRGSLSAGLLRDNRTRPTESLAGQHQVQAQGFKRNISLRSSYHGDVRLSRRTSGGSRTVSQDDLVNRVRPSNNAQPMEMEDGRVGPPREAARNQRQRARSLTEEGRVIDHGRNRGDHRVRRSQSERWQSFEEEGSSSEELQRESRREVRWMQRLPPRSVSQSHGGHSDRAGPAVRSRTAALDLGELEQVLLDEELARRLQEEEERLAGETRHGSSPLSGDCPEDFRMAQVAQDEEIARFIQKQEIEAKRRTRELDPVGLGQEYGDMMTDYDRRAACDTQLQRERMDSAGLQSPVDDLTTDHQLSSPVSMATQPQPIRNVAEELDPTFQRKEAGLDINGTCQNQGSQQVGSYNPVEEQSTFVPPTKRPNDKLGRAKTKDKKENIKQKENCKQQ